MKPSTLKLILLSLAALCGGASAKAPNIIFILADDLGWTDTAAYGSKYYETPNIDALAARGMKFTAYHNCQNCAPTRAALMSGQYGPRTGIYTVGSIDRFDWQSRSLRPVDNSEALPLEKITIAQTLKNAGYATAMYGKWHLGNGVKYHPSKRGFDEAIVSDGKHFDFNTNPETAHPKDQYLADFLTDRAVDFIRREKDGPFFLYLPHFGVHVPFQVLPDDKRHFDGKEPVGGHRSQTYAGMIYAVDRSVGRITALLDELNIAGNTVVIFSSDNGGLGGYDRPDGLIGGRLDKNDQVIGGGSMMTDPGDGEKGGGITDNAPLRSGKGSLYEGGTRVPFIVRWPGSVSPGATSDAPAIHVDVYPTLLEIAGVTKPENHPLDGTSLVPVLRNAGESANRPAIYQHFPGYLGFSRGLWRTTPVGTVQSGDWKLMEYFEDGHVELYNLRDDIGEQNNLSGKMPEKVQELKAMMIAWRQEVGAIMPARNEPQEAHAGRKNKGKGAGR